MASALVADVVREGVEIRWTEGFSPVALLPMQQVWEDVRVVDVASGAALEELNEVGEGDDGSEAEQDVHVVGGAASGDQNAAARLGLASKHPCEAIVEGADERGAALGRPDDVNVNVGRRSAGHDTPRHLERSVAFF